MDSIITATVREILPALPVEGAERQRFLRRAAELCAAREAAAALGTASQRSEQPEVIAEALKAANAIGQDGRSAAAGRESLQRVIAMRAFTDAMPAWIAELRGIAVTAAGSGACTIATASQLWLWTAQHFLRRADRPESVLWELADSFSALAAARCQILETVARGERGLLLDLCHLHAARTAGTVAALCAELIHGYRRHPAWDAEGCASCFGAEELDELEGLMPGFASSARSQSDVIEADGSHPAKAGPCVRLNDVEGFTRLRAKLDGCLTGARLACDRAVAALAESLVATAGQ